MIRVHGDKPAVVSFVQKGVDTNSTRIASEQVAKAASAEVVARTEFENAHFRLEKATAALSATEIAYQEAVAKGAWNREELRASYNNSLAGFRDADKAAETASLNYSLAKSALAGIRTFTKAISNGEELKAAVKNAKTPADRKACVDAAEKMKLIFFLPKGWKAEADKMEKSVAKANETHGDAEKKALALVDTDPTLAMEILNNIADDLAVRAGNAKQAGDIASYSALALEGGRVRGLATRIRQEGFDNKFPVQDIKDITNLPLAVVGKSFTSTSNLRKEITMPDAKILVICPMCAGDDDACPTCGGDKQIPYAQYSDLMGGGEDDSSAGNAFTTKALLTRDFEKSAGYQNYIFITKGGEGSGAQPGHAFNGNQWTGGMSAGGRLIHQREGHKVTMKRYQEGVAAHTSAAEAQKTIARGHESQGRYAKAAEAMRAAAEHHKMAAGFHEGIAGLHKNVHGDEASYRASRGEAAKQRVYMDRANDEAARLDTMAA